MAPQLRPKIPAVIEQLFDDPKRFDFFQAVRLLERHAQLPDAKAGECRQFVGRDAVPKQEVVRFRARQSLEFPVSEIDSLRPPRSRGFGGR